MTSRSCLTIRRALGVAAVIAAASTAASIPVRAQGPRPMTFLDMRLMRSVGAPTPNMDIALRAQASAIAMSAYFRDLLPERRQHPGQDLVSQLVTAEASGGIITTKELLAQCCTLLFAGNETTRNLLGNGMLALLRHPDQWQSLLEAPSLLPQALRELLRFDSPVQPAAGSRWMSNCTGRS